MPSPPQPPGESRRLEALREYGILDSAPEEAFDLLTEMASCVCQAPIALISLVDEDRLWFKSRRGWDLQEISRVLSFCSDAILHPDVLVVSDARKDPRFADSPLVIDGPRVRFYAGAPLVTPDGHMLGTICVLDHEPRELHPDHEEALRLLSRQVMALLELRRQHTELAEEHRALAAQRALRQAEEQFGQIVTNIGQVFWMTDPRKTRMLYVSPAYERIWGRSCESLYADPIQWLTTIHPEDRERIRARMPAQLEGAYQEEYRILRPDGSIRWILDQAFPVRNEADEVYRVVGVAADITERKQLEEELRQSEAGKRAVWESALDAILTMDHEGRIVDLNPAAEQMFECRRGDALGQPMAELIIPHTHRARHRRGLAHHLATGEGPILGRRLEMPALRADGSEFPAELTVVSVPAGTHPVYIGTVRDVTERREAHEALVRERNLSRQAINSLPGIFYLFDATGRYLLWNENLTRVTGYSDEECRTLHPLDFFRGDDRELIAARIAEVFAEGESSTEATLVAKDGTGARYFFTGRRIEVGGEPCIIGSGLDVSALRQAQEERDRFFELSPDLFVIVGFDGMFRQVNPALERLLGFSREEVLRRPSLDFVHPEDRERSLAELARVQVGKPTTGFENRYVCRDGSVRWVSWSRVAVPEERLVYAVGRDVTQEKEVAAALTESEERYRELVEGARDAIFTLGADGRFVSLNSASETITGWPREEWLGRGFAQILHLDDIPLASRMLETALRGESVPSFELRVRGRDGVHVPLELTATAQRRGGKIVGVLGIARDVRERHRMEEQLRQIQRLDSVGRLAAGIAHDFNNLLTVQQGHLSLLLMESGLPAPAVEHVQEAAAAAERAAALTQQLLLFSRKRPLQRQRMDLNQVVSTLGRMLDRVVGEDIVLEIRTEGHLPPIEADAGMMEQVLMNLVVNARDAMPDGGRLKIATGTVEVSAEEAAPWPRARKGRFVCLTVSDTGTGIPPEVQERMFEPFFTTKDVGKGTGLGLATVHGIVTQHGGGIEVDSAPGAGTTFRVWIPAAERAPDAMGERASEPPARGGRETILAVEDDDVIRRLVSTILERQGYRVLSAAKGREALELWREHGPSVDLLLTDLVMPHGMSGWELANRLWGERPGLRVTVMTGYDPQEVVIPPGRQPYAFLPKPFAVNDLLKAVRDSLDDPARTQAPGGGGNGAGEAV